MNCGLLPVAQHFCFASSGESNHEKIITLMVSVAATVCLGNVHALDRPGFAGANPLKQAVNGKTFNFPGPTHPHASI
jgi:hypothetical protein